MKKRFIYLIAISSLGLLYGCEKTGRIDMVSESDTAINAPNSISPIEINSTDAYHVLDVNTSDITDLDISYLFENNIEIINDPSTGIPREIKGTFTTASIKSPEDALKVLLSLRTIMGIKTDSFCSIAVDDERSEYIVYTLEQLYNGVLVDNGVFNVVVDKRAGTVVAVSGIYQDNIMIETNPLIDSVYGLDLLNLTWKQTVVKTDLVIYDTEEDDYLLCWKYDVQSTDISENKTSYVNAKTGEVVKEIYTTIS